MLISHDIMSIQKYCDRIAVLQSGRIIQTGAINTINNATGVISQKLSLITSA